MRLALVGQPNSGKSTIFNAVAGYRAVVSNFPGTTVETLSSRISWEGGEIEILDLPGIYSLSAPVAEESEAREHLFASRPDALLHIVDASVLHRSLELTIELLDLGLPLVLGLNMMDEAERKGVIIDREELSRRLGIPVVPMIAARGQGIEDLFRAGRFAALNRVAPHPLPRNPTVERCVREIIVSGLEKCASQMAVAPRFLALQLLENDPAITAAVSACAAEAPAVAARARAALAAAGQTPEILLAAERHARAVALFESTAKVRPRAARMWRERVDEIVTHPLWGYPILALTLAGLFVFVFYLGDLVEEPLLFCCQSMQNEVHAWLGKDTLAGAMAEGVAQGLAAALALILPYLIPFLFALALLEDIGYLPRVAFLMDAFMHRIGLHGKAVIPLVLGYGCTAPAIMSIRILEHRRDRFIASVLVNFIPCAARSTVIFALIGFTMGFWPALGVYLLNFLVVAFVGRLLCRWHPDMSLGMILELPTYKIPNLRAIAAKIWLRLRDFIVLAWPILIVSSAVLSVLQYYNLTAAIDAMLAPFVAGVLGLPPAVGMLLILGILRKEMTVLMLAQALGTNEWANVLSPEQIAVFTVFVVFYTPCVATLAMIRAVLSARHMLLAFAANTCLAVLLALITRAVFALGMAAVEIISRTFG